MATTAGTSSLANCCASKHSTFAWDIKERARGSEGRTQECPNACPGLFPVLLRSHHCWVQHYSVLKSLQQLPSRAGNSGLTSHKRTVTELKIEVSLEGCAGPWGKARQCLPIQAEPDSGHWGCRPLPVRQARLPWFRSPEGTCPVAHWLQSRPLRKQAGEDVGSWGSGGSRHQRPGRPVSWVGWTSSGLGFGV